MHLGVLIHELEEHFDVDCRVEVGVQQSTFGHLAAFCSVREHAQIETRPYFAHDLEQVRPEDDIATYRRQP